MIAVDLDDKNAAAVAAGITGNRIDLTPASEPTHEAAAQRAMADLIAKHNDRALKILDDAAGKIEALKTAIRRRGEQQIDGVTQFAGFVSQTLAMADVIMGPINELADTVRKATDP